MSEYRKECAYCLSNNICLSMAQYDSIYCMMMREFDYKELYERKEQKNANRKHKRNYGNIREN